MEESKTSHLQQCTIVNSVNYIGLWKILLHIEAKTVQIESIAAVISRNFKFKPGLL